MEPNTRLEEEVINRFVVSSKRERYLSFVSSAKRRGKFIADLPGAASFLRMENFEPVAGIEEQVIEQALRTHSLASSACYVISEDARFDTQTLSLSAALRAVVGWGMAALLVFGNAEVVYYEGEGKKNRYISR